MWNSPYIINYAKNRDLVYSYQFHQNNLNKIYSRKHIQEKSFEKIPVNKKILRTKQLEIKTENQHLLQKVAEIQTSKGTYSHIEAFQTNKKSNLNIESRIRAIKNIMDANAFLENRIRTVPSTIRNREFENSYYMNQQYCSNLRKFNDKRSNGLLISTTMDFKLKNEDKSQSLGNTRNNFLIKSSKKSPKITENNENKKKTEVLSEKIIKINEIPKINEKNDEKKNDDKIEKKAENGEKIEKKPSIVYEKQPTNINVNVLNEAEIMKKEKDESVNFDKNQIIDMKTSD